jgi:hypothetical protein
MHKVVRRRARETWAHRRSRHNAHRSRRRTGDNTARKPRSNRPEYSMPQLGVCLAAPESLRRRTLQCLCGRPAMPARLCFSSVTKPGRP